ncbi:MAG: thymidylate kinase [Verrucomicrobiales bacterium]|nr:thymidylate kinase [Verrucomicrobiales bacterium]MBE87570.1 thymidylate kinase [Verrucomicrobiales bacterium]|tara:strand:- start:628 stop:1347 length:720 start_codon:yes stop_codon:yes gene_type:complete
MAAKRNSGSKSKSNKRFLGYELPGVKASELTGKLIVIEGADGSGRSTQIKLLVDWLEAKGYATTQVGLKRSNLASEELERAKNGNILNRTTLSLFYATDFADQLENIIIPSLRAGFIVLADRYIYTLMARDLVRGLDNKWVHNLYSIALKPDAVFYLKLSPEKLIQRNFMKNHTLDYWESGMDLGLSKDMFDSFVQYQKLLSDKFDEMRKSFDFTIVDSDQSVDSLHQELRNHTKKIIN